MLFPDTGLSTSKQNIGSVILQILSSLRPKSHYAMFCLLVDSPVSGNNILYIKQHQSDKDTKK
jgi:hypothetical protein